LAHSTHLLDLQWLSRDGLLELRSLIGDGGRGGSRRGLLGGLGITRIPLLLLGGRVLLAEVLDTADEAGGQPSAGLEGFWLGVSD